MARSKIYQILLASSTLGVTLLGLPAHTLAGPEDGTVTAGAATITQSGLTTAIHQSSDRAIIDWRSFDVNADESVRFYQPGSSSITLNRINDSKASFINGTVTANGQILLLNQNGIVFGSSSRVDVAGLVASTGRVNDAAFMSGATTLNITAGDNHQARIINNGTITARDAGLVGLVAPNVENNGIITAQLGKVTLAGAERFTLDLAGDGLISIDVDDTFNGSVKNTGTIIADGGTITMTASRARDAVEQSIVNTGTLQANSVGLRNGRIILSAGGNRPQTPARVPSTTAAIKQAGKIQASSGAVEVLGDSIHLADTSVIDVSAEAGNGGTINIGGSFQGAPDRVTATWVEVDRGSSTKSNGDIDGNGGTIIFWADRLMSFRGSIEAEGGADSGDGGFVEVSGKNQLFYDGYVSTRAAHGKTGTLLLDPTDIEISNAADQNVTPASPFSPNGDDVVSVLNATTLLNALASSSVIVQTRATGTQQGNITVNAALSWGSGNTLTLDAHNNIVINQAISGANLTLSAGNDVEINAALNGSGLLHILSQSAGGTMGIGTGASGILQLSDTDLGNISDGWATIRLGRSDGAGVLTLNAHTWSDHLELNNGSGAITINGTQTLGANNLTIRSDSDLVLNAAVSGSGNLVIEQTTASTTIGLGNAQAGSLNLTTAEIGNISNGWNSITFGRADGTAAINLAALTWNDHLTIQSASGIISVNGIQTLGANNLTYITDANLAVGAALNGTGVLSIRGQNAATTIGIGTGQAGAIQLTNAEAGNLDNTWSSIVFGRTNGTGDINVGALTWVDPITYQTSTSAININGAQSVGANNLTFISDANPLLAGTLSGTGNLSFQTASAATSIGLAGEAGIFNLSEAELLNIMDGWVEISIGTAAGIGAINVGAHSWNDALLLQSGSGVISINGTQTMGANTLTVATDSDLGINAALTGSGTLNLRSNSAATSIGIAGGAGLLNLSTADLANLTDGWGNIIIGNVAGSGAMTVNAATWNDNLTLQSSGGVITIAGAQTMGANTLRLHTDADLALNGALTGSGNLVIQGNNVATTLGLAGQAGTLNLTTGELNFLTDGWSNITIGRTDGTGAVMIGAESWTDNLTLYTGTGVMTIAGAQTMAANTLTIRTDSDLVLNAALTGSSFLSFQGSTAATTIGLAGQTGMLNLNATELNRLTDGWTNINFGRTDGTGAITIGTEAWTDSVTFQSGTGVITVAGAQTMAANALTFRTDGDIALNSTVGGSSSITFVQTTASTGIGLGAAQAGALNLTVAEVANISNGWSNIIFGRTDGTGALNLATLSWNDNLTLNSGSGVINVNSTQTMTTGTNLTINTDADINLVGNLTGSTTSNLVVTQASLGTVIGLGNGAVGTINLTATEIGRITDGWQSRTFGRVDGTGGINLTAITWVDPLTLRSDTGVISITGIQTMAANALTITTNANLNVGAALNGTTTLTISGQSADTTIGIGTGQAGTIQLSDAEAANLDNTWTNINFGRADGTGVINVGALTWVDPVLYRNLTGGINIIGAQNMGTNNLILVTDGDLNIGAALNSTGTGNLTITGQSASTSIGIGTGQAGTLQLSDAEVANLSNNWANILIGLTNGTGAINVGTATWLDPLTLRSSSGQISINGEQTMGANNLTITTDENLEVLSALSGSGTLTIMGQTNGTTIGIGTGQAGTIQFSDAEVLNLSNTWANIIVGSTTSTGVMNVGAATWLDSLTLRTASGQMNINGAQTIGANNLTLITNSNLSLLDTLSGSGILTISGQAVSASIGIGSGNGGSINIDNTEFTKISDGWSSIVIGSATSQGYLNIGTSTWNDNLTLITNTGNIVVNGILRMNSGNNLNITSNSGPVAIYSPIIMNGADNLTFSVNTDISLMSGSSLTGSGNLVFRNSQANTNITLGAGASGGMQLTDVELARITDGWAKQTFQTSGTGTISIGANTWTDSVEFINDAAAVNITGALNMGANNLTITTNGNPTFSSTLAGSGILTIQGNSTATIMNIAGAATNLSIDNADLGNILNGWAGIIFGKNNSVGAMNIGAYTWQYDTTFRTGNSVITVSGAQMSNGNSLTYETDANMVIGANITGSGTLTIRGSANTTSMGLAGGGGLLQLSTAELNLITDGWGQLIFGRNTATGAFIANTRTWTDNVQFISGTGVMTVGAQRLSNTSNFTITTDSDLNITAALQGTGGILKIEGASATTEIGVGASQTGSLQLNANDVTRMGTAWSGIQIGNSASTGNINIGANNWIQPMTFITQGNVILNGAQSSNLTSGNSLVFASLGGNFVNNTGSATPITAGTGTARYLIYSLSAATDTYGTMTPPGATGMQTYFSYGPGAVVETGNRIIYSTGAPKVVYIQIDNKSKIYGDTVPLLTWTYLGGLQGADTLGNAITNSNLTASGALITDNAGTTRTITGSFTTGLGYSVSFTDGTLLVIKAPVTVQAAAVSREYGDANPTFVMNYIGLRNGETSAIIDVGGVGATTATIASDVNTYTITASGASDNNYVFNYANSVLTITKASLTITADDKTREYGAADPAFTLSYSGFKNGDTSAVINTSPTAAPVALTTDVGNASIVLSGGTDNNYNLVLVNGTLAITKATLTATADNKTRIYGDANPAFTTTYTGFKNGEAENVIDTKATATSTATALTDVGSYIITTSGAIDNNYTFVYADGALTINKATLTITADNKTRIYGDANPALTVSYGGFKNGETSSVLDTVATTSTAATALTDVGSYAITASGATDTNYNFTYVDGSLAITKATLTATADNKTRIYGDANPTLTTTYTGFKNGETASVINSAATATTAATVLTDVGSYVISTAGASDNNYDFTYVNGALAITKATLTATADNKTRIYGDANPVLTTTYTGFKNGESAGVINSGATATTSASALTDVGSYVISTAGASDNNYDFTYVDGSLAITKATLTATADNKTRIYGDANPVFTTTYTGFKNGENAGVINSAATATTAATLLTDVGSYVISTAGASDNNYDFAYVDGSLAITKATLTATADSKTRIYGDANPALTTTYTGFKNGENAGVINSTATATTMATAFTDVGGYVISTAGASDNNYDFTYVDGSLAITKATLTATADNKTRIYGDANPILTTTYTGFKNGENAGVINSGATATTAATVLTDVGSYMISTSGASDNNYDFTYVDGSLAITKATLIATADNKTRIYGDANPALTTTYTGFKNGENSGVINSGATAATTATTMTDVGNYTISTSGASDNNYDFTYVDGSLAINKATLTATADNKTRIYGDANPALTTTYTGFKNGENAGVINSGATVTTAATALTDVGSYVISTSGASDNNYDFAYVDGSLAITKSTLTATADSKTREYGDANPVLTTTYTGFKNGESAGVINSGATASTAATALTDVGSYVITTAGASDNNYDFTYVNGSLAITKATLTATADNKTRIYGDANPALTTTYTGFKNAENAGVINSGAIATTSATALTDVGSYIITTAGASDNNYDFTYVNGSLAINKATLTATADNKTRTYGDANPAFTTTYTGFKNGENAGVINSDAIATTAATALTDVGNYTISTSGASDNNYDFTYVDGSLAITKATLTATVDNKTREYGDANPALTATYTGFKNGENSGVIDSAVTIATVADTMSNAGSYAITSSGGIDNNYAFAYVDGSLTITKALVTLTVADTTREYGASDPTFTATYSGFKNGQNASFIDTAATFSPASAIGSNVGTYTITASGASDTNYSFAFINGNLLITQAALVVQADNQVRLYGDPNPPLTYTVNGLRNGDSTAVLSGLSVNTTATALSPAGNYAITIGGATAMNYSLSYANGSLQVVNIMPPTPAPTESQAGSTIPGTAQMSLTAPGTASASYDTLYHTPQTYIFTNSPATFGHEADAGTITTTDGYITIIYYQNPLEKTQGEPLLFIDPDLYIYEDEEDALASFVVH